MVCAQSCPQSFNGCRVQLFLLYRTMTSHSQCKIQTIFVRIEWGFYPSTMFSWVFTIPCSLWPSLFLGSIFLFFYSAHPSCLLDEWFMYIKSNFPSILCLGNHYQSWPSLVILSFDFFTLQDLIFQVPQHNSCWSPFLWFWHECGPGFCYLIPLELLQGKKFFSLT